MKIKLNTNLMGMESGTELTIGSQNGVPNAIYWRRRLEDSKTDNCIEVIKSKKSKIKNDKNCKN